ncbi:CAP domain-containing protein [Phenylobacterium sp. J367]|uniref:CAP domain-containing protein n=1 Tax=Phenylobacterium sp. J367 TaxID=2898435 RepID=UPI0021508D6C|nr:CAP domain-containing protein [Phenylobacterium sp. J367]MCR5878723.1 CAP domain-containing protein [Phenylobacterium sp. J367]
MTPSRRLVLAGGLGLAVGAAAPARTAQAWIAYAARLRERLGDAGGGRFDDGTARELLTLTNTARRTAGAMALAWHDELAQAARAHAADLAQRAYVEHLSPEGFDPTDRLGLVARRLLCTPSENIAYHRGDTPHSAADLMGQWRRSASHWTNLLRPRHSHTGFGVVRRGERTYAVGLYARPDGELTNALPFRVASPETIAGVVAELTAPYIGFWLEDQARPGRRVSGRAGPGVYRLRIDRRLDGRAYTSLYGPIFIWGEPS